MSEIPHSGDHITKESNLCQPMPKSSAPYSKHCRQARRDEVYRLYFDYGYSARKIGEFMKINRNTVNTDISYWYGEITKNTKIIAPEFTILFTLKRFDLQRIRLREQLDNTDVFQEKISLERLIYEIDSKIMHIHQKLAETTNRIMDITTQRLNKEMESAGKPNRFMTFSDKFSVSDKAKTKIDKIIDEDQKRRKSF